MRPETIAFLALRSVINTLSGNSTLQFVAIDIGSSIEDEVRYRKYEEANLKSFVQSVRRMKRNTTYDRRAEAMDAMMENSERGVYTGEPRPDLHWEQWGRDKRIGIGIKLINLVAAHLPLIEITPGKRKRNDKQPQLVIKPTETLKAWLADYSLSTALLSPIYLPTVIPPKPFTNSQDGGYHTLLVPKYKLVKESLINDSLKRTHNVQTTRSACCRQFICFCCLNQVVLYL